MKRKHVVASVAIGAAALATVVSLTPTHHLANASFYPNPRYTPGLAATQSFLDLTRSYNGQTYSQAHRNVTGATKTQIEQEYPNCPKAQEIDHFIPLSIGGSNDAKNLWCEPGTGDWNYHVKDTLESYLAIQVKAGTIAPKDAQSCILKDWVACWQKYMSKKAGAVDRPDEDDEVLY